MVENQNISTTLDSTVHALNSSPAQQVKPSKRDKFILLIALLTLLGGIYSTISSFPLFNIETAINRGGIANETTSNSNVIVQEVATNSPASVAGLIPQDKVLSANGQPISSTIEFIDIINNSLGKPVTITIDRNGTKQTVVATPRISHPAGQGALGLAIASVGFNIIKEPIYILIPHEIVRSYTGHEEKFSPVQSPIFAILYNQPAPYYDNTFSRLRELLTGIISIIVGIGLLKMKKWAYYLFLGLSFIQITVPIFYLLQKLNNPVGTPLTFNSGLVILIVGTILELLFVYYIFLKRFLFK